MTRRPRARFLFAAASTVAAVGALALTSAASAASAPVVVDTHQYHYDGAHSGFHPNTPAVGRLARAWTARLDGAVQASPLVVNGTVIAATEHNTVYGLSRTTGRALWSRNLGAPVDGSKLACGNINLSLTRFDGHPPSGAVPREGCLAWRTRGASHPGEGGRSRRSSRLRSSSSAFRGDRSVGQVSRDFDLTETAVREWVKQAQRDAGERLDGLTSEERDELAKLRRENRRLREDVDILKRATAFFAEETR